MSTLRVPNIEAQIVLACAAPAPGRSVVSLLAQFADDLDWDRLIRYATTHGFEVQLDRQLRRAERAGVAVTISADRRKELQARVAGRTIRNVEQTRELLALLDALTAEGFDAIPFKGPLLADRLYGDVALRGFSDLDLLVRRNDFQSVRDLLRRRGYDDPHDLRGRALRVFLRTRMGYELIDRHTGIIVEIHWAFINRVHAFRLEPTDVWARAVMRPFAGREVLSMSAEDLLLYLCAHGSKSFWTRAAWIADVAGLVARETALDWDAVLKRAHVLHGERMLLTGLRLARDLFDVELPTRVDTRIDADDASRMLAQRVASWLWNPPRGPDERGKVQFHLQMRERWRDRLPYYGHLVRNAILSRVSGKHYRALAP